MLRISKFNKEFDKILDITLGKTGLVLAHDRFLKFMINMGFLNSLQAYEPTEERALVMDIWRCLSRVHADSDRVIVSNLRTMLHAIVGLPIWTEN
jgi:hypothetical protein